MSTLRNFIGESIPKSINAYIIMQETGKETFGSYFMGFNKYTDDEVRIKVYSKELIRRNTSALSFINCEIFCMKMVHHKSFIKLLEFFETKRHIFIVTDVPKGKKLENILSTKYYLKEEEAKKIFFKIVEAMIYLHSTFICHRDINPSNIYYDESTNEITIDNFFFSSFYSNDSKLLNDEVGHPSYCCNEIYKKEYYNPERADVWSCGILLYKMLNGKFPFLFEEKDKQKERLLIVKYEPEGDMSKDLKELLSKILEVSWVNRPDFKDILKMSWFGKEYGFDRITPGINILKMKYPIDDKIMKVVDAYGFNTDKVRSDLKANNYNNGTALYKLIVIQTEELKRPNKSDLKSREFFNYVKDKNNLIPEDKQKAAINYYSSQIDNFIERSNKADKDYDNNEENAMNKMDSIKEEYKKYLDDEEKYQRNKRKKKKDLKK
ncbi:MAG: protein kinase [archaeon]|nr:protein kinase [archaeon]